MEKLERRVEEMEVRISFQEDHIRQLDEVLQRQADLIDHLQNQLNALREYAAGHGAEAVRERFGTALSGFRELTIEQGKSPEAASLDTWEANTLTTTKLDRPKNQYSFMKIEEILPPADKKLEEARGYVIADYQDKLEKEWVASLRDQYEVSVNEEVLESLVRGQ